MLKKGTLYIIPGPLGEHINSFFFAHDYIQTLNKIKYFIVEEIRTTRRFLKKLIPDFPIDSCSFAVYNEHNLEENVNILIEPLLKGYNVGIISESGCPTIADPGNKVVLAAHHHGIKVVPIIGPSSIILALMASGLPAQSFKFNGYLPAKTHELLKIIQKIEKQSQIENLTQIFIETPYRNQSLLNVLIKYCSSETLLCVASNLTQPDEFIATKPIYDWRKNCITLKKVPSIFLLYSGKL